MRGPLATGGTGHNQFEDLFDGVDDLIKRVADVENPEIRKIRAKVHAGLVVAKSAAQNCANQVRRAAQGADDADEALVDCPQEFGFALLVALGLGLVVSLQPE